MREGHNDFAFLHVFGEFRIKGEFLYLYEIVRHDHSVILKKMSWCHGELLFEHVWFPKKNL